MDTSPLLATSDHLHNPGANGKTAYSDIRLLKEVFGRFKTAQVDPAEFACLKAVALFKPGKRNDSSYCVLQLKYNKYDLLQCLPIYLFEFTLL